MFTYHNLDILTILYLQKHLVFCCFQIIKVLNPPRIKRETAGERIVRRTILPTLRTGIIIRLVANSHSGSREFFLLYNLFIIKWWFRRQIVFLLPIIARLRICLDLLLPSLILMMTWILPWWKNLTGFFCCPLYSTWMIMF